MLLSPFYHKWPKRKIPGEAVLITLRPQRYLTLQDACCALIGKLLAQSTQGAFIVHLDNSDPDPVDEVPPYDIFNMLSWLNLEPDEFLDLGMYHPYNKRQRRDVYKDVAMHLFDEGLANYSFCSTDDAGEAVQDCCEDRLDVISDRLVAGERYIVRLKNAGGDILTYDDPFYGTMTFDTHAMEDVVLLTADGMPTPYFANVVDNHFMHVTTHVRYESALSMVTEELLLYNALRWERPTWLHIPEVIDPEIRNALKDSTVEHLQDKGYFSEAIVQYLWQLLLPNMPLTMDISLEEIIVRFRAAHTANTPLVINHDDLQALSDRFSGV